MYFPYKCQCKKIHYTCAETEQCRAEGKLVEKASVEDINEFELYKMLLKWSSKNIQRKRPSPEHGLNSPLGIIEFHSDPAPSNTTPAGIAEINVTVTKGHCNIPGYKTVYDKEVSMNAKGFKKFLEYKSSNRHTDSPIHQSEGNNLSIRFEDGPEKKYKAFDGLITMKEK